MAMSASTHNSSEQSRGYAFLERLWPLLYRNCLREGNKDGNGKVVDFVQPDVLKTLVDLRLSESPCDNDELIKLCEDTIKYSVKTGHPHFFNQLYQGIDEFALGGSYLTETLHATAYTFEIAPLVTLMEMTLIETVGKDFVKYNEVDGIFCPGGSISNMYGINLARFHKFPQAKQCGMQGIPKVHIYTSELSHYCVKKGASFMGFGLDSIVFVKADDRGRMLPSELDRAIAESKAQGVVPLIVVATEGTTVFGAYDPLHPIADVCQKHGVWLHADAAWGGSVIVSSKRRHKMDGIERTDSVTWDPHKMMGSMQQCSLFITRHTGLLRDGHCSSASYLFQQDKCYDVSYDIGDKSIQCGRRMDALRLWLQWKARGTVGLGSQVDRCFDNCMHLVHRLRTTPGFRLLLDEPECTNVCFWYIPPSMRQQPESADWWCRLGQVAPKVKARMQEQGTMLIGYQPQGQYVNFFRFVLSNPDSTEADMDFVVDEIARLGADL